MGVTRWLNWLRRIALPGRAWRIVARAETPIDVPTRLPRNGAALVGSVTDPRWLIFDCPCRANHRVMLNLDRRRRPAWRVTGRRQITIAPSIDDHVDKRRCHFLIVSGRVRWIYEDAREAKAHG